MTRAKYSLCVIQKEGYSKLEALGLGAKSIDTKTLYNWRKHKPELYKKVMQGFALGKVIEEARLHYENLKNIAENIK